MKHSKLTALTAQVLLMALGLAACQNPAPTIPPTSITTEAQSDAETPTAQETTEKETAETAAVTDEETEAVTEAETEEQTTSETESSEPALPPIEFAYKGQRYTLAADGRSAEAERLGTGGKGTYDCAFFENEMLSDDFSATLHAVFSTTRGEAGLLFCASQFAEGIQGYALTVRANELALYRVGTTDEGSMDVAELYSRPVATTERQHLKAGFTIRVEKQGDIFRLYYLDDAEGVEPWPELEIQLENLGGIGVGYIDNGYGASFGEINLDTVETAYEGLTYQNPICPGADPFILYHDGLYYLYATNLTWAYDVYTSPDLCEWTYEGICAENLWGISSNYWAPEVFERDGKFYLVATVDFHVGIAVADSPLGPFIANDNWLLEGAIDGHVFVDDDERAYLYVADRSGRWHDNAPGKPGIACYELTDDLTAIKPDGHTFLFGADGWEQATVEGPYILKHNGLYYLTYSGDGYESDRYGVGYAVSESPTGPFEKCAENPILHWTPQVHGPGHHSFTTSPDGTELLIVYHKHYDTETIHPRQTCIDRVRFSTSAVTGIERLEIYGPTYLPQPIPSSAK